MTSDPVDFYLFEDNELDFSILLEGNDPEIKDPDFRFIIHETHGMTWVFKPIFQSESGLVKVKIPKGIYVMDKNKELEGKLEIIIGDRYFSPIRFEIRLITPVSVKAEAVAKQESITENASRKRLPIVIATLVSSEHQT